MAALNEYLEQKKMLYNNTHKPKISDGHDISDNEKSFIEDMKQTSISHAKSTNTQTPNSTEKTIEKKEKETVIDNTIFLDEQNKIEDQVKSISLAKLTSVEHSKIESKQEKNIADKSDEELTEEQLKTRKINRARRDKQKTEVKESVSK